MMTKLEVLRAARKLLSDPKRWTKSQWHAVKHIDGEEVHCHCAEGALAAACGIDVPVGGDPYGVLSQEQKATFNDVINAIREAGGYTEEDYGDYGVDRCLKIEEIPDWNDHHKTTYEDVMAVFSAACEAEFAKEQSEQTVAVQ